MSNPAPIGKPSPALPRPPEHLSVPSRALFEQVVGGWALDPTQVDVLVLALEARDQAEQARVELVRAGALFVPGHKGPRPHPAVTVHRDASLRYARLVRQLDLDPAPAVRGPLDLRPRRSDHR